MTREFDIRRMCRLDGRRPTAREHWTAFYRLWRIARKAGAAGTESGECFRVLFPDWRFIQLLDSDTECQLVNAKRFPPFIRRDFAERRRRKRLYGNHPEWVARDKIVAQKVRDRHGMEVTPLEVAQTRRKIINMAREKAAEMGVKVPADDDELLRLLKPR